MPTTTTKPYISPADASPALPLRFSTTGKEKALLGLAMAVILLISLFFLSKQSLRLDEAQSLWQSARSPSGIIFIIAQDVHVPLYLFILHFWQFLFGNGVATARVLSLLFFLGGIPLLYKLGRLAYNRAVAWFAVLLTAASPFLNWYGNEIRMYSLMVALGTLSHLLFLSLFKFPSAARQQRFGWWLGYGLTALLGIYTHYFFWLILASQALFYLIYRKKFAPGSFLLLSVIFALLLAAIAPWLYYVVRVVNSIGNSEPLLVKPSVTDLFNTFSQFLFGFQNDHINTLIVSLWPLTAVFAFWAIRKNVKITAETVYFMLAALFPIFIAFAISLFWQPLFLSRYLIFSTTSLYLLLGWTVTTYSRQLARVLRSVFVASMAVMLIVEIARADTPAKEDYKSASLYVSRVAAPQDAVLISAPFTIYPFEYYYRGQAKLVTLPVWNRYKSGAIPRFSRQGLQNDIDNIKTGHQKAYLVLSYDQGYEQTIKQYFDGHFPKLEEKNFSPRLNLYVYDLNGFNSGGNPK